MKTTKEFKLISIGSMGISIVSGNVMLLGEMMGIMALIFSWYFLFVVGSAVFKFR